MILKVDYILWDLDKKKIKNFKTLTVTEEDKFEQNASKEENM
jgi:hypothetical protein